jgi:hypothetical protein
MRLQSQNKRKSARLRSGSDGLLFNFHSCDVSATTDRTNDTRSYSVTKVTYLLRWHFGIFIGEKWEQSTESCSGKPTVENSSRPSRLVAFAARVLAEGFVVWEDLVLWTIQSLSTSAVNVRSVDVAYWRSSLDHDESTSLRSVKFSVARPREFWLRPSERISSLHRINSSTNDYVVCLTDFARSQFVKFDFSVTTISLR